MNRRPFARALLASVAVAAAVVLAGCNADSIAPGGRAQAPLSDKMLAELEAKHMDKDSPILIRLFKEESELEVWKKDRDGQFALLKKYPICRWSGELGPKIKEGDRQAPEGFYTITPGQMNPRSSYYLAFNTGYPNAFDRAWGRTGSELMVHGDCSSRGCYAMTDEQIQEIYALARESFFGGQKAFQFEAFPFRMTALNMAKHHNNPNMPFWKMLKVGYDHFEVSRQEPKVDVCDRRYVFDAVPPDGSTKPLNFSPRGSCPVYQVAKDIAAPALEKRREDEVKTAQYIAEGVHTVPVHTGVDGGMNPVFEAELASHTVSDNDGRTAIAAGGLTPPGYLPRDSQRPPASVTIPEETKVADAEPAAATTAAATTTNVPVPRVAPRAKSGETPQSKSTLASFFGNLFGGGEKREATPHEAAVKTAAAHSSHAKTVAAKKAHPAYRTAAVAPAKPVARAAAPAAKIVAHNVAEPDSKPAAAQQTNVASSSATAPMRTAYSGPTGVGLMAGAQPVLPTGSFASRWAGLR
ncbi:MAG TPA: murein L,D-transpeptidase family protein [Pseudolabrys sp.]|nr:murein L,D-transpeptidase family protein [Pseudolabrys sp.]